MVAMTPIEAKLAEAFCGPKCTRQGAQVEKLAMSGTGISRLLEIQPYRYLFVSCKNCGYTETYNPTTLEGNDDLDKLLEIQFANSH